MTDTTKIEPALSAADFQRMTETAELVVLAFPPKEATDRFTPDYRITVARSHAAPIIAVANAALPDSDPRKITREWVRLLRAAAYSCEQDDHYVAESLSGSWMEEPEGRETIPQQYRAMADTLASYLPPEGS